MDPRGVEAVGDTLVVRTDDGFQMDPRGVEASLFEFPEIGRPSFRWTLVGLKPASDATHDLGSGVSDGPSWG